MKKIKNKLYVMSDLHGTEEGLGKAIDALNNNRRVIILGDATDRGKNGFRMLMKIKYLMEHGYDMEYIVGNHDDMIYETLRKAEDYYKGDNEDSYDEYIRMVRILFQHEIIVQEYNGVESTYIDIMRYVCKNPKEIHELYKWLGDRPLELIEEENGKKYALGHAAFDMDIFENNIKLKNTYGYSEKGIARKAIEVLWYRENKQEYWNDLRLPTKEEADEIIVGHTPYKLDVKIVGKNLTRTAINIDGGLTFNVEENRNYMTVFDPSRGGRVYTAVSKKNEKEDNKKNIREKNDEEQIEDR